MTQHRNTSRLSSINLLIIITRLIDNSNSDRLSASSPCPYHYQSLICSTVLLNFKQSIAKTRENRLIVGLSVAFSGLPATSLRIVSPRVQHTLLLTTGLYVSIPRAIRECNQQGATQSQINISTLLIKKKQLTNCSQLLFMEFNLIKIDKFQYLEICAYLSYNK